MSEKRILIFSALWTPGQPSEATTINANALVHLLAEQDGVRPMVFTQAPLAYPLQRHWQGRVLYIVVGQRWPRRWRKLVGWLTTRVISPHVMFFLNRHALSLLPSRLLVQRAHTTVAYLGERRLSSSEAQMAGLIRKVYVEDPSLQALVPHATVQPMGTNLRPFTLSKPPPAPPWRICFASSPLPWHSPEETEMTYLKGRGVLDILRLVEVLHHYIPVHLTLVWRKNPCLVRRLTAHLPFVSIEAGTISDMNAFLGQFHLYAALFRPGEERYYKPLPNSVVEAMAKGILPLAYTDTLIGKRIASVSSDLLLSPVQDPAHQAEALAHRLPALYTPETRVALRRAALRLDLGRFVARLLEDA